MDDLRRLQARVYGPAADGDVDAARRLARLTAPSEPAASVSGSEDEEADHAKPAPDGDDAHAANRALREEGAAGDAAPTLGRRRPSWTVPVLWAGSIVATAALAVAITTAVLPPRTTGAFPSGTEPVAFLAADPTFAVPRFLIGVEGDAVAFEEFAGLRPLITTGGAYVRSGTEDQTCLTIAVNGDLDSASSTSYSGLLFEGCTANGFEASTQLVVTDDLPSTVTDEFPVGTALQFVYDADIGQVLVSRSDP